MVDSAIAILLGVILVEMARFGGHVSVSPPASPEIAKRYMWRFRIYALLACVLIVIQGVRTYRAAADANHQQNVLKDSIDDLRGQIQKSDTGRQVDDAILETKLQDYRDLQDLAPALMKIAQVTESYTQKEYEASTLSKSQLLARAEKLIAGIRSLGSQCAAKDRALWNDSGFFASLPEMTPEQRRQQWTQHSQAVNQASTQNRQQCATTYQTQFQGEAADLRRELLNRDGGDSFLLPQEKYKYIAIDGIFAGVDPIDDSADYLEALANQLKQLPPRR